MVRGKSFLLQAIKPFLCTSDVLVPKARDSVVHKTDRVLALREFTS